MSHILSSMIASKEFAKSNKAGDSMAPLQTRLAISRPAFTSIGAGTIVRSSTDGHHGRDLDLSRLEMRVQQGGKLNEYYATLITILT